MKDLDKVISVAAIILLLTCSLANAESTGTVPLVQGWNLISLPVQPANASIASVLSGIKGAYEVVWAYPNQAWQVYDPNDSGGSTLTSMQAGMGYWIKMSSAKTLSVSGIAPPSSLSLQTGWNLVGWDGASCTDSATAVPSIGAGIQVVWGYPGRVWQFYDPANSAGALTKLCPGLGYWLLKAPPNEWTWASGSSTASQEGVYGTEGVAAPGNVPGARDMAVSWTDPHGNLWLFSGYGYDSAGNWGYINNLWKFDGTNWTWASGSNTGNQSGVYGTEGVAAQANIPGARDMAVSWTDPHGNFWLFGGYGYDSTGTLGFLNDLWKFDGTNWTWASGSNTGNQSGVYGTEGVAAPGNVPGGGSAPFPGPMRAATFGSSAAGGARASSTTCGNSTGRAGPGRRAATRAISQASTGRRASPLRGTSRGRGHNLFPGPIRTATSGSSVAMATILPGTGATSTTCGNSTGRAGPGRRAATRAISQASTGRRASPLRGTSRGRGTICFLDRSAGQLLALRRLWLRFYRNPILPQRPLEIRRDQLDLGVGQQYGRSGRVIRHEGRRRSGERPGRSHRRSFLDRSARQLLALRRLWLRFCRELGLPQRPVAVRAVI